MASRSTTTSLSQTILLPYLACSSIVLLSRQSVRRFGRGHGASGSQKSALMENYLDRTYIRLFGVVFCVTQLRDRRLDILT